MKHLLTQTPLLPILTITATAITIAACSNVPPSEQERRGLQDELYDKHTEQRVIDPAVAILTDNCYPLSNNSICITTFTDEEYGCEYLITTTGIAAQGMQIIPRIGSCDDTSSTDVTPMVNILNNLQKQQAQSVEYQQARDKTNREIEIATLTAQQKAVKQQLQSINDQLEAIVGDQLQSDRLGIGAYQWGERESLDD